MYNNSGSSNKFIRYAIFASIVAHAIIFSTYAYIIQTDNKIIDQASSSTSSISLNFAQVKTPVQTQPVTETPKSEIATESSKPDPVEKVVEVKKTPKPKIPNKNPVIKKPVTEKPKKTIKKKPSKKIVKKKPTPKKSVAKKPSTKKLIKPKKIIANKAVKPNNSQNINQTTNLNNNVIKEAVFKGRRRAPNYPKRARMLGLEGEVTIKMLIDINGKIKDIEVLKSSGHKTLDRAAIKAARRDRFVPKYINGTPVNHWAKTTYQFVLR